ncbi:helix-turn-helix domain-containing protein [Rathayibacter sp. YIM 133350]|uniref:helix-turn-helix domain-containing protein n=1 Tax=Rathayibacter sp. YIM 133350 TaxID=3131992 RepID=UPI00307E518D
MTQRSAELETLGHRIRHHRIERGLTLDALGERIGMAGSQLSLIENGKREVRVGALQSIADALGITVPALLSPEAPNARAALEIELATVQRSSLYGALGLPRIKPTRALPDEAIEAVLGLYRELQRRASEAIATPEEARRANTELRERMRQHDNHLPEIERLAEDRVRAAGHQAGALTHREVSVMAEQLGFQLIYVNDLPDSTRSITDIANGRIYLPPASIPGGHGLRSMALQALAHRVLAHEKPASYAEFLQQRLEINYFAACCLMPEQASVAFLQSAKKEKRLAIEDFRDAFGVTHEAAALRFTNLATAHLDMRVHFLRVKEDGALLKGYENDDLPLPTDVTGSIEGQWVCKKWSARSAFTHTNRTTEFYQYTDTPAGTYWCATQTGRTDAAGRAGAGGEFSISVGVPFSEAKWFRGRETTVRALSRCPDESCCRRAPAELAERWAGQAWPSARLHAQILSPLPSGTFPGVDDAEVYAFLEAHATS